MQTVFIFFVGYIQVSNKSYKINIPRNIYNLKKKVNVEMFTLLSLEISPTKLYIVKHLLYLVPVHAH